MALLSWFGFNTITEKDGFPITESRLFSLILARENRPATAGRLSRKEKLMCRMHYANIFFDRSALRELQQVLSQYQQYTKDNFAKIDPISVADGYVLKTGKTAYSKKSSKRFDMY